MRDRPRDAPRGASPARGRPGAARILLLSELRRRGRVYAFLAVVFAFATASLVILLGSVNGVLDAIGAEIEDTLAAEWRVVDGDANALSEGFFFNRSGALAERLEAALPGAVAVPRIEIQGVFLHSSRYEDFDSGLIVGVDPAKDPQVARVQDRIDEGRFLDGEYLWIDGTPYPQLVVGEEMLRVMGMRVYDGSLSPANLLNVTAGRFATDGGTVRPVVREGVVVGTFETGFEPLDRRIVFTHVQTARELLRMEFEVEPANVLLVRAPEDAAVREFAAERGLNASSSREFRDSYLSAVFSPLRAFTAIVSAVVLVLAGGWVAHVAAQAILSERQRIAVLRALGFPTALILGPVSALVVATGIVGGAAGFALGWMLARLLEWTNVRPPGYASLKLLVTLPPGTAAAILAAVLATAVVAALGAGLALRRIPVTEALRG